MLAARSGLAADRAAWEASAPDVRAFAAEPEEISSEFHDFELIRPAADSGEAQELHSLVFNRCNIVMFRSAGPRPLSFVFSNVTDFKGLCVG